MKKINENRTGLIAFSESDIRNLLNSRFIEGLKNAITRSIKDIYNCDTIFVDNSLTQSQKIMAIQTNKNKRGIRISVGIKLLDILINGFNIYCNKKGLKGRQINILNPTRLFEYIWGFRKAIFVYNENRHRDVQFFQVNLFRRMLHEDIMTSPHMDLKKYSITG